MCGEVAEGAAPGYAAVWRSLRRAIGPEIARNRRDGARGGETGAGEIWRLGWAVIQFTSGSPTGRRQGGESGVGAGERAGNGVGMHCLKRRRIMRRL
jgi:hypothetical protein